MHKHPGCVYIYVCVMYVWYNVCRSSYIFIERERQPGRNDVADMIMDKNVLEVTSSALQNCDLRATVFSWLLPSQSLEERKHSVNTCQIR